MHYPICPEVYFCEWVLFSRALAGLVRVINHSTPQHHLSYSKGTISLQLFHLSRWNVWFSFFAFLKYSRQHSENYASKMCRIFYVQDIMNEVSKLLFPKENHGRQTPLIHVWVVICWPCEPVSRGVVLSSTHKGQPLRWNNMGVF